MRKELLWSVFVYTEKETEQISRTRLNCINSPCFIRLDGEIGAGKTFFATCIAKCYGVRNLTSATYLKYSLHKGVKDILHIDFYRIQEAEHFFYDQIEGQIENHSIVLSEWTPDGLELGIPQYKLELKIKQSCGRNVNFLRIS